MRTLCALGSAALVLLGAYAGSASTWYVGPAGNDKAGNGTKALPWRTVGKALTLAAAGDEIRLLDDGDAATEDYKENVEIPVGLDGIKLVGGDADGLPPLFAALFPNQPAILVKANGVVISGLDIQGVDSGAGIEFAAGSKEGRVEGCRIPAPGGKQVNKGVWLRAGSQGHGIQACEFQNGTYAVLIDGDYQTTEGHVVEECLVEGCTSPFEVVGVDHVMLIGNEVDGGATAINLVGSDLLTVVDNKVSGAGTALMTNGLTNSRISGNDLAATGTGLYLNGSWNLVSGNVVKGASSGGSGEGMGHCLVLANEFSGGNVGFELKGAYNLVYGNTFSQGAQAGLVLNGKTNLVTHNICSDSGGAGVLVKIGGNHLYTNDFGQNKGGDVVVNGDAVNVWHSPVPLGWHFGGKGFKGFLGNHYEGGYSGSDDGSGGGVPGDGIGDTELPVSTDGEGDGYPLSGLAALYGFDTWYLTGDGGLVPGPAESVPAEMVVAAGEAVVFVAAEPAATLLVYPAGNIVSGAAWTYGMHFLAKPKDGAGYLLEVGWADSKGTFHSEAGGPMGNVDATQSQTVAFGMMQPGELLVPTGGRLSVRFTNQMASQCKLSPALSFVSPAGPGQPLYPTGSAAVPLSLDLEPGSLDFGEMAPGVEKKEVVQISNAGNAPISISKLFVLGEDAGSFTMSASGCLEQGLPVVLDAGGSCTVEVRFLSKVAGLEMATLVVVSDDAGAPVLPVELSANSGPVYMLSVTVEPPGGGSVTGPGIACPQDCAELVEKGKSVTLEALPAAGYGLLEIDGCDLLQGGNCTVQMQGPAKVVAKFKALVPVASVSPEEHDFGQVMAGKESEPLVVTVENLGDGELVVISLTLGGPEMAAFELAASACAGEMLAPGEGCDVVVTFRPEGQGLHQAVLTVTTSDPAQPVLEVALSGTGLAAPSSVTVEVQPAGSGSVSGDGVQCPDDCTEAWATPKEIVLSAKASAGWELSGWQGCNVGSGGSGGMCKVAAEGDRLVHAWFRPLLPNVALSAVVLQFAKTLQGGVSGATAIHVTNAGTAPLGVEGAAVSGFLAANFEIQSDGCEAVTLAPGKSCEIAVAFAPKAGGMLAASLLVSSDDPLQPVVAAALVGEGEAKEEPVGPDPTTQPVLSVVPAMLEFGARAVGEVSGPVELRLSNSGQAELAIVSVEVLLPQADEAYGDWFAAEAGEFAVVEDLCTGKELGSGAQCVVTLTHRPAGVGVRHASVRVTSDAPFVPVQEVVLQGTGLEPGGGGGCSATGPGGGRPAGRGSAGMGTEGAGAAALLASLLVLLACCRIRHWRHGEGRLRPTGSLLRIGFRSESPQGAPVRGRQGIVAVLLLLLASGCVDGSDACVGDARLSGTGEFAPVNGMKAVAISDQLSCEESSFLILDSNGGGGFTVADRLDGPELVYISNTYFVSFYLGHPLFVGRYYGKGTNLSVNRPGDQNPLAGFITSGGIRVKGVHFEDELAACVNSITLEFDLTWQFTSGAKVPLEELTWKGDALKGTVTFSSKSTLEVLKPKPGEDVGEVTCLPPQFDDMAGSLWDGKTGQNVYASGINQDDVLGIPPTYWGTEVNLVKVEDVRIVDSDGEVKEQFYRVDVTPPADGSRNFFCDWRQFSNQELTCLPGKKPAPFVVKQLPITLVDRWGLWPELEATWEQTMSADLADVTITAPEGGADVFAGEPLTVRWAPHGNGGESARVTVSSEDGGLVPLVLQVPDTGEFVLEPPMLAGREGVVTVQVVRRRQAGISFPWPVKEGSAITVERGSEVQLVVLPGCSVPVSVTQEVADGWTAPMALGNANGSGEEGSVPVLATGPDGAVHLAFLGGESQGSTVLELFSFEPVTGEWSGNRAPAMVEPDVLNAGPLGLSAAYGRVLVWGHYVGDWPSHPVAWRIEDDGTATQVPIPIEGTSGPAAYPGVLLPDGRSVFGWRFGDGTLHLSVDGGPFEYVAGDGSVDWGSRLFAGQDGTLLLWYTDNHGLMGWIGTADSVASGVKKLPDEWIPLHYGFEAVVADGLSAVHFLGRTAGSVFVPMSYYGAVGLEAGTGGDLTVQEEIDLPFAHFLGINWAGRRVAAAQDGTVWGLYLAPCGVSQCPFLVRRHLSGTWTGPYLPSHVSGTVYMAVDGAGRVHLVYAATGLPGELYHTMMEVVP